MRNIDVTNNYGLEHCYMSKHSKTSQSSWFTYHPGTIFLNIANKLTQKQSRCVGTAVADIQSRTTSERRLMSPLLAYGTIPMPD